MRMGNRSKSIIIVLMLIFLSCNKKEKELRIDRLHMTDMKAKMKRYINLSRQSNDRSNIVEYDYVPANAYFSIGDYTGDIQKIETFGKLSKDRTAKLISVVKTLNAYGISGLYYYDNIPLYFFPYKRTYKEESEFEERYLGLFNDSIISSKNFKMRFKVIESYNGVYLFKKISRL